MNMNQNSVGVALVKEQCFICGATEDGPILMNTILNVQRAKKVEELHGKTIGFLENHCESCKGYIKEGIALIGVDPEKTTDKDDPYRSGGIAFIRDEAFERIFNQKLPTKRIAFIEHEVGVLTGIWKSIEDGNIKQD